MNFKLTLLHQDSCPLDVWNMFYNGIEPKFIYCDQTQPLQKTESKQIYIYQCKFSQLTDRVANIQKSNINLVHGYCAFVNNSRKNEIDSFIDSKGVCIFFSGTNSRISEYRFYAKDCHIYRKPTSAYSAGFVTCVQNSVENHKIIDATIANCGGENEGQGAIFEENLKTVNIERINISSITSYSLPIGYTIAEKADNIKYCNFINNCVRTNDQGPYLLYNLGITAVTRFEYSNFINNSGQDCGASWIMSIDKNEITFYKCSFIRGDYNCNFFILDGKKVILDSCYSQFKSESEGVEYKNNNKTSFTNFVLIYGEPTLRRIYTMRFNIHYTKYTRYRNYQAK